MREKQASSHRASKTRLKEKGGFGKKELGGNEDIKSSQTTTGKKKKADVKQRK